MTRRSLSVCLSKSVWNQPVLRPIRLGLAGQSSLPEDIVEAIANADSPTKLSVVE